MKNLDFELMEKQIDSMYGGDIDAILAGMDHQGCLMRINAVISAYDNNIRTFKIVEKLKVLKEDKDEIDSISVGDYAKAVLHLYGIEKYEGNKKYVIYMIESKMNI